MKGQGFEFCPYAIEVLAFAPLDRPVIGSGSI